MCICMSLLWRWWMRYSSCVCLAVAPSVRSPGHISAALPDLSASLQLVVSAHPFPVFIKPHSGCERGAKLCDVMMWISDVSVCGWRARCQHYEKRKHALLSQTADGMMKPIARLSDKIPPFENLARIWEEGRISASRFTVGPLGPVVSSPLGCN